MMRYTIRRYQPSFESTQVRIGADAARNWIWPYAHDADSLKKLHAAPGFDPHLWLYALSEGEVVGFVGAMVESPPSKAPATATIFFPRVLPQHDEAAALLLQEILNVLAARRILRVIGRVTTMNRQEIGLAESAGFTVHDWGYKMYYAYATKRGRLAGCNPPARQIDPDRNLEECSQLAANWYKQSPAWCLEHLRARHNAGIIAHLGVWRKGKLIASCLAAPNEIRPTTAALYYIYVPDELSLEALLHGAVNACIESDAERLIADLIHEHRTFEPVYQKLGFRKVADWARCEKVLAARSHP